MRKSLAMIAVLAASALGIAACGDDSSDTTSAASDTSSTESTTESTTQSSASGGGGAGGTIAVAETEYKLDPADATVNAGSVTIDVSNDGQVTHNLEVEGSGVEEVSDDLNAGSSGKLALDLKPGEYEMYCAIDGHRDLGMEGTITVN